MSLSGGAKNMGSNIPKALVELLKTAVKKTEPYPLDSEEAVVKYDDPRMQEGHPEYDRMTATIALKTLTEYGIPIE